MNATNSIRMPKSDWRTTGPVSDQKPNTTKMSSNLSANCLLFITERNGSFLYPNTSEPFSVQKKNIRKFTFAITGHSNSRKTALKKNRDQNIGLR